MVRVLIKAIIKTLIKALPISLVISAMSIWMAYAGRSLDKGGDFTAISHWLSSHPLTWLILVWLPIGITVFSLCAFVFRLTDDSTGAGAVGFVALEVSTMNLLWFTAGHKYVEYLIMPR